MRRIDKSRLHRLKDTILLDQLDKLGLTDQEARKWLNQSGTQRVMAVRSDEPKRPLKKGEWYLSGAIVEVYRAYNDLDTFHVVAKLVKVSPSADIFIED